MECKPQLLQAHVQLRPIAKSRTRALRPLGSTAVSFAFTQAGVMMRNALLFRETTISKQKKSAMTKYRTLSEKKVTVDDRNPTQTLCAFSPCAARLYHSLPQLWVRPWLSGRC